MELIKVKVNSIFIPIVREDLKFKETNNSFGTAFKVPHSSYPLRLIETLATKQALGEFKLDSTGKKREFSCLIYVADNIYTGVLVQNARIGRFRKCDIVFSSPITAILDNKLSDFMDAINVLGQDPAANPYSDTTEVELAAFDAWQTKATELQPLRYPATTWQLPKVYFPDLYTLAGEDPAEAHASFSTFVNQRNSIDGLLMKNYLLIGPDYLYTLNHNVISPMVFVLAPIDLALQSIGYRLEGSFPASDIGKSLLFDTYNNNMSELDPSDLSVGTIIDITPIAFNAETLSPPDSPGATLFWNTFTKRYVYLAVEGAFRFIWDFTLLTTPTNSSHTGLSVIWQGEKIAEFISHDVEFQSGEVSFEVSPAQVGDSFTIVFYDSGSREPLAHSLEVVEDIESTTFIDAHPTIEFNRYLPSWSIVEAINNLSNILNLKVDIDDIRKTVSINFNQEDYLINGPITRLNKSAYISGFNNIQAERYILKYENDDDTFINVSRAASEENLAADSQTTTIENRFRFIDRELDTSLFSRATEDKSGVGLLFYDPANAPRTTLEIAGLRLSFSGANNIYSTLWKKWLNFRLTASNPSVKIPLSKTELEFIQKSKKIYLDDMLYLVREIQYKETRTGKFLVELDLLTVTY